MFPRCDVQHPLFVKFEVSTSKDLLSRCIMCLTLSHAFPIYAVIPTAISKQPINFPCTIALYFKK
jgi:hypothetical protein